ncbi:hypothetical protein Glove_658g26 [Diversispora epigaea]|uniref:HMG box domain-containing protein n=1 Tax=Diversispora epigaea TaxID=1348612 RepID=A0A397G7Y6_9GLOM|nr:hypothetical protein Glove_658g26 [Diversispora epigaea]
MSTSEDKIVREIVEIQLKNGVKNVNRTMNPFMIYRRNYMLQNSNLSRSDVSKLASESWKNESNEVRDHYKRMAENVKKEFKKKVTSYGNLAVENKFPQLMNVDQNLMFKPDEYRTCHNCGKVTYIDIRKLCQQCYANGNNVNSTHRMFHGTRSNNCMYKHYSKDRKLEDEKKKFRLHSKSAEGGQHNFEGFNHCLKSVDGGTDKMEDYSNNNKGHNGHYYDNERNEIGDHVLISSQANANIADGTEVFQNFTITSLIWAKIDPAPNDQTNLEVSIDLNDCRAGKLLSDKWPLLHKLGIGYFIDSVEIGITPIQDESNPSNFNKEISNNHGIGASISRDLGVNFNYGKRNEQSFTSTTTEWELIADGCGETGLRWRYQYSANSPFKDLDHRRRFAPGEHSCKWRTFEAMSGFRITITQVLRCEITDGWRKYNPITRSKLKKLCPKMAHTLEMSFNSLENFDENFANLKNSENSEKLHGGDFLNVTFSKNASPQIENSENSNIGNIEIKRSFTKFMSQ